MLTMRVRTRVETVTGFHDRPLHYQGNMIFPTELSQAKTFCQRNTCERHKNVQKKGAVYKGFGFGLFWEKIGEGWCFDSAEFFVSLFF